MMQIPLSNSEECALVDDADYAWLMKWCWKKNYQGYPVRSIRRKDVLSGYGTLFMHKDILEMDRRRDVIVDHIDSNPLNCQRSNLRVATYSENSRNCRPHKGKRFKGITQRGDKWIAKIFVNYKAIYLGLHVTIEDAARAYDKAAKEHFGEFAKLNFPGGL